MNRAERRIAAHTENLGSQDPAVSRSAERYLIRHYAGRATDALIRACSNPNPVVRYRAAWTLGLSKDPAAFETILGLTDDPDEGVRYDAVLALGKLGDERAIEPLFRMALTCDATRPASNALWDFGMAAMPAVEALYGSGSAPARWAATQGAGNMAAKEGCLDRCVALLKEACEDSDSAVGENARCWLDELGVALP